MRRPNFVGDTTWLRGEVTEVGPDSDSVDSVIVGVSARGVNQRDEETTTATAKVRLDPMIGAAVT